MTPPNSPTSPNSPLPASLILQIPHLPINLNTTPPNSPTSPNFPLPASLILQIPHLPINLNTTPPNSPNSPPYAPNSLPHSAQIPYNPPGSPTLPTPPSILSQFSTPFGSNPPIIPLALPTPQHLATSHYLLTADCSLLIANCSLLIANC